MAKKIGQPNIAQAAPAPLQPSAPPLPSLPQSQDPIKVEPNPFLRTTNPFMVVDSHLSQISEIQDEIDTEDLEGMTLKELDALQQTIDEDLDDSEEDQNEEEDQ